MSINLLFISAKNISLIKISTEIKEFSDYNITALAEHNDFLYVGVTQKYRDTYIVEVFIYNLKTKQIINCTKNLVTSDKDIITNIEIDERNNHIWIETNGNGLTSDCYDVNLKLIKRHSDASSTSPNDKSRLFLENRLKMYEKLQNIQENSIWTFDFNDKYAVVGFFKGNIYLYDFQNQKSEMIYKPSSIYNWPISSVLNEKIGIVGTIGDGLIIFSLDDEDRKVIILSDGDTSIDAIALNKASLFYGSSKGGLKYIDIENIFR